MKKTRFLTIIALLAAACGGEQPVVNNLTVVQCEQSTDCGCSGDSVASCQTGMCYCSTEKGCEAPADCACDNDAIASCKAGICYCATSTVTKECPDLTRGTLALILQEKMNLSCEATECTDVVGDKACAIGALQKANVFPKEEGCRPDDSVNRAELVKIVITAIDGLANYVAPTTPTFDDVEIEAWYFDYVEAASQLGLVHGDVGAQGGLSGDFRPADTASTCWAFEVIRRAFEAPLPKSKLALLNEGFGAITITSGTGVVSVQKVGLEADVNLMVTGTRLTVRVYDVQGTLVGSADEAAYSALKSVQVVEVGTGAILQGPFSSVVQGKRIEENGKVSYSVVLPEDFDLFAGKRKELTIGIDVATSFPSGYSFDVEFSLVPADAPWTSYCKDAPTGVYFPSQQIIGGPLKSGKVSVN